MFSQFFALCWAGVTEFNHVCSWMCHLCVEQRGILIPILFEILMFHESNSKLQEMDFIKYYWTNWCFKVELSCSYTDGT